jgi:hypothetical protein
MRRAAYFQAGKTVEQLVGQGRFPEFFTVVDWHVGIDLVGPLLYHIVHTGVQPWLFAFFCQKKQALDLLAETLNMSPPAKRGQSCMVGHLDYLKADSCLYIRSQRPDL